MIHPRDYLPAFDQFEAALEDSCGALMTLQHLDAQMADWSAPENIRRHISHAVRSLRIAIEELRHAQGRSESGLALGCVLASGRLSARRVGDQSSPRRTA